MVCTFFGHRTANYKVKDILESTIRTLIKKEGASVFYVGTQGAFDYMACEILSNLKETNKNIKWYKVLAYLPVNNDEYEDNTLYPEGLELIPKKFAIIKRNEWMINKSDTVITYVRHSGGAANAKALAESKGKKLINI